MTTMVEKVARALAKADGTSPDEMFVDKRSEKRGWEFYMEDATAAIEAMLEPTFKMKIAWDWSCDDWISEKIEDPYHPYTVMVQAALKEGQE